ncbi:hypothetical protein BHM03_00049295, partial [Ensete ventricosum]
MTSSSALVLTTTFLLPLNHRPSFLAIPSHLSSSDGRGRSRSGPQAKWKCCSAPKEKSASTQQRQRKPPRRSLSGKSEPDVDPVGFLSKFGISHRGFAQFLRERCSATLISPCASAVGLHMFGPNSPQTDEELGEILDAETRYKQWKEVSKFDHVDDRPRFDVIDDEKEFDIFSVKGDPVSAEKFKSKKPPLAYWIEMRKGRKAWLKKYMPAISHGSRYKVYFNTPDGALERVPAWATYVLP